MNRHGRRWHWSLSKADHRMPATAVCRRYGLNNRSQWRTNWRASWSTYRVGGEAVNVTRKGSVLRCYDRGQERRRHDAAVRRAREALAG